MKTTIFIPNIIHVGFKSEEDTYNGLLAYIIYFDSKNTLRKERSFKTWIDKTIPQVDYQNDPTSGFVLNKKVGGDSNDGWNHRQTYTRVYDPRGFEFEITIPNLLYILQNTNSIKGKGLEGDFVYGWDGESLLLIPTSSPDYIEITKYSSLIKKKELIYGKDLITGGTYITKSNETVVFLGRFNYFKSWSGLDEGQKFFFKNIVSNRYVTFRTVQNNIIDCTSKDCISNYAELMDELEHQTIYSPQDETKNKYIDYTIEELNIRFETENIIGVYLSVNGKIETMNLRRTVHDKDIFELLPVQYSSRYQTNKGVCNTLHELHDVYCFKKKQTFQRNGNPIKR